MFNDLPCDDIDGCTVEDFCQQGLCLGIQLDQQDFVQTWDWESGALDDWTVEQGGPISIVAGHESPFGLRVEGGGNTRLKATGTIVEPFDMTGQKGSFLPLAEGAFMHVDMTISVPTGHGVYLDIYIHGKETKSRWICYPFDGYGSSEDLGDGWYRNHFHNHHVYGYEENWGEVPPEVPYMTVTFNSFAPAGCTIDGFIIQPNLELAGFPQECQQ
jgi:hypothetical protein